VKAIVEQIRQKINTAQYQAYNKWTDINAGEGLNMKAAGYMVTVGRGGGCLDIYVSGMDKATCDYMNAKQSMFHADYFTCWKKPFAESDACHEGNDNLIPLYPAHLYNVLYCNSTETNGNFNCCGAGATATDC
jgi:hypothetical protein